MATASDVSRLLQLGPDIADFSAFVPFIRDGFSRKCFEEFLATTTIAEAIQQLSAFQPLAEQVDDEDLSPEASDCLLRIARIYAEAIDLFDNQTDVAKWMTTKSYTLGNQIPIELLDTTVGFEIVFQELMRIQYGIAS